MKNESKKLIEEHKNLVDGIKKWSGYCNLRSIKMKRLRFNPDNRLRLIVELSYRKAPRVLSSLADHMDEYNLRLREVHDKTVSFIERIDL